MESNISYKAPVSFTTISANILSGNTIYSGNTNLSDIFQTKTSELVEVDDFLLAKVATDFAVNSGETRAAISCQDNTINIMNLSISVVITSVTASNVGHIRYCPAVEQFWCLKTDGSLFYRISTSGGTIIDTVATNNAYTTGYPFDCDDSYVYVSIMSGSTNGVLRIKQSDTGDTRFFATGGNLDKHLKAFRKNNNWYFAAASTYGFVIYDSNFSAVCSTSLGVYLHNHLSVSPSGNYAGLIINYYQEPGYERLQIVDITNFTSPQKIIGSNKLYTGELLLEDDKFIWNTRPSNTIGYDGRIMLSDYTMSNVKFYPGVYRNYTTTLRPQTFKIGENYYLMFSSSDTNAGTHIKKFKIT